MSILQVSLLFYLSIGLSFAVFYWSIANHLKESFIKRFAFSSLLLVGWLPVALAAVLVNSNNS
jgi:hypothetical protein